MQSLNSKKQIKTIILLFFLFLIIFIFIIFVVRIKNNNLDIREEASEQDSWTMHVIDNSSRGADGVKLADVNYDEWIDITTGWEEGGKVKVYLNPKENKITQAWPSVIVGEVGDPEDAHFVDLDKDGFMDVVSSTEGGTKKIFIHWAPSNERDYLDTSKWKTEVLASAGRAWMFVDTAQIDGRNGIDIVAGSKGKKSKIGWFEAAENPRNLDQWEWHPITGSSWVMSLFAIDMNGDEDVDVLVSDRGGKATFWLENPGQERVLDANWNHHIIYNNKNDVRFLGLGDLDQDGFEDVITTLSPHNLIFSRRLDKDGLSWENYKIKFPDGTGSAKGVGVGDINLDGKNDLVISTVHAENKQSLMWLSYNRTLYEENWQAYKIMDNTGTKFDLVEILDLDKDGDLDILTCEERENLGVIWYKNPLNPEITMTPTVNISSTSIESPTQSHSPTISTTAIASTMVTSSITESTDPETYCGAIDTNRDNKVDLYDFQEFKKRYNQKCTDEIKFYSHSCGGKDYNHDGIIDIKDFNNFIGKYKQGDCK